MSQDVFNLHVLFYAKISMNDVLHFKKRLQAKKYTYSNKCNR
jgi:hypothetical protein